MVRTDFYRVLRKILACVTILLVLELNSGWISPHGFVWAQEMKLGPEDPNAQSAREVSEAPRALPKEGIDLTQTEDQIFIDDDSSVSEVEKSQSDGNGSGPSPSSLPVSVAGAPDGVSYAASAGKSAGESAGELNGASDAVLELSQQPEIPVAEKNGEKSEKNALALPSQSSAPGVGSSSGGVPVVSDSSSTKNGAGAMEPSEGSSVEAPFDGKALPENATSAPPAPELASDSRVSRPETSSEPASILVSERSVHNVQSHKTAGSKISASVKLLERLAGASDFQLEGVESIELRTFLNAPLLSGSRDGILNALPLYWETASIRAEIGYWETRANAMERLAQSASADERSLYELASASAKANLSSARILLRTNAVKLGNAAGYSREVTARTLPHAGNYETRYEEIRSSYGVPSGRVTYFNGMISLRQEQLSAATAACLSAENLLNYEMKRKQNATAIILAWDLLNERRVAFFKALLAFNQDILNYVLEISPKRGADLAPLLARPVTEVDSQRVPASGKNPTLPAPPQEKNGPEPTFEQGAIPNESAAGVSAPQLTEGGTTASPRNENGLPAPKITDGKVASGANDALPTVGDGATYEENAFIAIDVPAEPTVPGGELGVPETETPPPGNDFKPIGGETGVDTNPVLAVPARQTVWRPEMASDSNSILEKPNAQTSVLGIPGKEPVSKGSSETGGAFSPSSGETISLRDVLQSAAWENRFHAVAAYWNYVSFQKQICVLEYQQEILKRISSRILKETLQGDVAEISRLGLYLEFHSLVLRTELLENKAEAWTQATRLRTLAGRALEWPMVFPEAVTEMKSEDFQVRLDRFPAERQNPKALAIARQLYFCVQELPRAFQDVNQFSEWLAPSSVESSVASEDSEGIRSLKTMTYPQLDSLVWKMKNARICSARYFQLLYFINSSFSSCILAGTAVDASANDSALLLEQYGS